MQKNYFTESLFSIIILKTMTNIEIQIESLNKAVRELIIGTAEMMSVEQAAMVLGVSKAHLYRLMSENKITYYRGQGGKIAYFDRHDIYDYMRGTRIVRRAGQGADAATCYIESKSRRAKGGAA